MVLERFSHYIIDLPEIDKEHKQLALALHRIKTSKLGFDEIVVRLKNLANDIADHFKMEEQIMRNINFPYYDYHKTTHDKLLHDLDIALSQFKITQKSVTSIMEEAIYEHTDTYDRDIAKFINENKHDNTE